MVRPRSRIVIDREWWDGQPLAACCSRLAVLIEEKRKEELPTRLDGGDGGEKSGPILNGGSVSNGGVCSNRRGRKRLKEKRSRRSSQEVAALLLHGVEGKNRDRF
jgi:hypothetical protein